MLGRISLRNRVCNSHETNAREDEGNADVPVPLAEALAAPADEGPARRACMRGHAEKEISHSIALSSLVGIRDASCIRCLVCQAWQRPPRTLN